MSDKKLILVIDDDPDIIESVEAILSGEGFRVVTAMSGQKGIEAYREEKPDLVLCDMMMEHIDEGSKVADTIRAEDTELPVFLVSSIGDATARNISIGDLGFNGVFQKPIKPEELIQTINQALSL